MATASGIGMCQPKPCEVFGLSKDEGLMANVRLIGGRSEASVLGLVGAMCVRDVAAVPLTTDVGIVTVDAPMVAFSTIRAPCPDPGCSSCPWRGLPPLLVLKASGF